MHIMQKKLSVLNPGIAVFQIYPSQAYRFYFRALKGNPRFQGLFDEILVTGLTVLGQDLISGLACSSCYLLIPFPDN
jgi:hypothetical protein